MAQGRSHLYEGYSAEEVTRIIRLFSAVGAKSLILTNAAGGISRRMTPGSLMLVQDQVNVQWRAPSRVEAENAGDEERLDAPAGPRGLGARPTYPEEFLAKAAHAATMAGVRAERGVLGVMLGPSYETPAEIAMLERMGADAVCMSTAAEASLAGTIGLPVAAISCITNWAAGKGTSRLSHADLTAAVAGAAKPLRSLLERLILALAWLALGAPGTRARTRRHAPTPPSPAAVSPPRRACILHRQKREAALHQAVPDERDREAAAMSVGVEEELVQGFQ